MHVELTNSRHAKPPPAAGGGLYVHIPFCLRKCPYCDFFSITDRSLLNAFLKALVAEAALHRGEATRFDTIYIGGGTPSVLTARQVGRILDALHAEFAVTQGAEVTLEVNPGTVDAQSLRGYRLAGVNRLNIGVQSFRDDALAFLGRIHDAAAARRAVAASLDAGFERVGLDLIYGLPGQTAAEWRFDLEAALAFSPHHLSCYMLSIEPGTPLDARCRRGAFAPLGDSGTSALFVLSQSALGDAGYTQYEISNFARSTGDVSRHNLKYWILAPYLGLGPAAHSFMWPRRWWHHRHMAAYLDDVARGELPLGGEEILDDRQQIIEALYLGLRMAEGIRIDRFDRRFGVDFETLFLEALDLLKGEGLLSVASRRCALTRRGLRFHEGVVKMLIRDF